MDSTWEYYGRPAPTGPRSRIQLGGRISLEPIFFVLTLVFFVALAFGRRFWQRWRDSRRERLVRQLSQQLVGEPLKRALEEFGEPFGVFEGAGRTLYEWKSPPSVSFPAGTGLLIFYVISDSRGIITHASWQTRGEENWRQGAHSAAAR